MDNLNSQTYRQSNEGRAGAPLSSGSHPKSSHVARTREIKGYCDRRAVGAPSLQPGSQREPIERVRCRNCECLQSVAPRCRRCGRDLHDIEMSPIGPDMPNSAQPMPAPPPAESADDSHDRDVAVAVLLTGSMEEIERAVILARITHCHGNLVRAAASLGIGKTTIYRKVKEWEVPNRNTKNPKTLATNPE